MIDQQDKRFNTKHFNTKINICTMRKVYELYNFDKHESGEGPFGFPSLGWCPTRLAYIIETGADRRKIRNGDFINDTLCELFRTRNVALIS
ncbi:hypothetical protein PAV_1c02790 [Paenibacillus alvei DSM 29]|nr:hypothetical protein PAV_1c02790 [Paenibacillus alvei DSM 29]